MKFLDTFLEKKFTNLLHEAGVELNGSNPWDPQFHTSKVLWYTSVIGSLGLGDAYMKGWWDCERLDIFFEKVLQQKIEYRFSGAIDAIQKVRDTFFNLQAVQRSFHVAEKHYDLGNDFYEKMLGQSMGYSSGYFKNGATNLQEAQYDKFDAVCKKLQLKPGMKILEIGCGWGSFAEFACKNYGVSVVGVTVSKEQLAYAKNRCKDQPVDFYFGDYRTMPSSYKGAFDRVVSIEMIEAVGIKNLPSFMKVIADSLTSNGEAMLQVIIGDDTPDLWISTRIFPNGVLPSMSSMTKAMRPYMRISHLETFGEDYDKTLMAWNERFIESWETVKNYKDANGALLYDEEFYRMWHYYLMVCAGIFRSKKVTVGQLHLTKEGVS